MEARLHAPLTHREDTKNSRFMGCVEQ
jgi:hypothetical protein